MKSEANTFGPFFEDLYSNRNEKQNEKDNGRRLENNCDNADDDEKFATMNKTLISQNLP